MQYPDDFPAFRALSAALGSDPLRVQGPGGNTSIKDGDVMWIKASGTELANALTEDIFPSTCLKLVSTIKCPDSAKKAI